jgi:hypothetical protein
VCLEIVSNKKREWRRCTKWKVTINMPAFIITFPLTHFIGPMEFSFFKQHSVFVVVNIFYYLFSLALQPSTGYGLLVTRGFLITHNNAPQSVGLLWMSDQLVAETSTWQYTTDKHPCPSGIQTHDRSRWAAIYLRLRPCGR